MSDVVRPQTAAPEPTPLDDPFDRRLARRATGLLATFNAAGVLDAADVHVATRLARVLHERAAEVLLAVALTVRAVRQGSVCLDLDMVHLLAGSLPWPDPAAWRLALEASPLVTTGVLHLDGRLLYLDRYWVEEGQVVRDLRARRTAAPPVVDAERLEAGLDAHFPTAGPADRPDYVEQRGAARAAAHEWTSVITGGPGTGKTTTIARLLGALLTEADAPLRIALAAPTGKAAARMTEALRAAADRPDFPPTHRDALHEISATTMHRLLGWRPDSRTRFTHDRRNPLPHDVVVIDETSMVSLTMMARLLEAVRPQTRLVLVGDADQLASVDAGAVLKDLVEGLGDDPMVTRLGANRRFGSEIAALASAIRDGDVAGALAALGVAPGSIQQTDQQPVTDTLVGAGEPTPTETPSRPGVDVGETARIRAVRLVPDGGADDVVRAAALDLVEAAQGGDPAAAVAALERHRLLCAHRTGEHGVRRWNHTIERWVQERLAVGWLPRWYAGQPLLVTANDYGLELFNGDTGIVVRRTPGEVELVARLADGTPGGSRELALTRLADVETAHAMTVHRSQGSQFAAVTVILPPPESPLLTREMLYTAVTRAQERVVVVGSAQAVAVAVSRPAQRASGLASRLRRP